MIAIGAVATFRFVWSNLRPRTRLGWTSLALLFVAPVLVASLLSLVGAPERVSQSALPFTMALVMLQYMLRSDTLEGIEVAQE